MLENADVLVLDIAYQPLCTINWQKAFCLYIKGKVEILEEYADLWIHSAKNAFKVPSVIRFIKKVLRKFKKVRFSRESIYIRDNGTCQYCNKKVSRNDFTLDHVCPKTKGGKTCFENTVVSCIECNRYKSDKTLNESGLKLVKIPVAPKSLLYPFRLKLNTPKEWLSYLYWNTELIQD